MARNSIILLNFLPDISSTYTDRGATYPSTATMLLGTVLKKSGYNVRVIDGGYHPKYLEMLKNSINQQDDILYVGMTVMTTQIPFALESSSTVKKCNPAIPVIWGGAHPTLFPEQTLRNENVNIIAINEGVATTVNLAECLQSNRGLSEVNGIGFKNSDGNIVTTPPGPLDDIRQLPHFDFSLIEVEKYLHSENASVYQREFPWFKDKVRVMPILTGLGCPYKCEFCINPILERRYRYRPAESILQEIKHLQSRYDVNTFLFLDEDFFVNKNRVMALVSQVEQEGLHFNWRTWCRVDHFKDDYINSELIKRIGNIGYGSLAMGAESADQEMLDSLKKHITPEQIMNSLKLLSGSKIFPRYSFMVGLENESMKQIRKTYEFCFTMTEINPAVDIAGPFIFRLYPGSPIYDRLTSKYNLKIPGSLDDWAEYLNKEGSYTEMPWTPLKFRKNLKLLMFYASASLASYTGTKGNMGRFSHLLLRNIARLSLRKIARLRLKYFFFKFPFEYWGYSVLIKILQYKKQ